MLSVFLRFSRQLLFLFSFCLLFFVNFNLVSAASLELIPSSGFFNVGCDSRIDIFLDTEGVRSTGVDVILNYNPSQIDILDKDALLAGTQISEGSLYSIYMGNEVDEVHGQILLSAFNILGYYNGSGIFGSIFFVPKPGVSSFDIDFDFLPGSTTDSNVSDISSDDILSSVVHGSFSSRAGYCSTDTEPPRVTELMPINASQDVPLDTHISFRLTDNQSGIDLTSFSVQIYTDFYDSNSPELLLKGNPANYSIDIDPVDDFPFNTEINGVILVSDLDGNVMPPMSFFFNPPDRIGPSVVNKSPGNMDTGVDLTSNIEFDLIDSDTGVDLSTFTSIVNGVSYSQTSPELTVTGGVHSYHIRIDPRNDFQDKIEIIVQVDVFDFGGNGNSVSWSFNKPTECNNGIDDDGDLEIDFPEDDGCTGVNDNDETDPLAPSPPPPPLCSDGVDNDLDDLIDFPEDPGCDDENDANEWNPPLPVCGNSIVEEGEECEPPNTAVCDERCKIILTEECLKSGTTSDRSRKQELEPIVEEETTTVDTVAKNIVEGADTVFQSILESVHLKESSPIVEDVEVAGVSAQTFVCKDVVSVDKQVLETETPFRPPEGYEVIQQGITLDCSGGAYETTVSIPSQYIDVRMLKCKDGVCSDLLVNTAEKTTCGVSLTDTAEAVSAKLPNLSLSQGKIASLYSKYVVDPIDDNASRYSRNRYDRAYKFPIHPSLKFLSVPIRVLRQRGVLDPDQSEFLHLAFPFLSDPSVDPSSVWIYVYDSSAAKWNALPEVINLPGKGLVQAEIDFSQYSDDEGRAVFAVMGVSCPNGNCESSMILKKVYEPSHGSGLAFLMLPDLGGDLELWQSFIDDIRSSQQPWQAWTYKYSAAKRIAENAEDLALQLESYQNDFDTISLLGYGLGGLVAEEALRYAYRENTILPGRFRFLNKVKILVALGTAHDPLPSKSVLVEYYNYLTHLGEPLFSLGSSAAEELIIPRAPVPRIPGVKYYAIAGNKPFEGGVSEGTDGLVAVNSAQHIGGDYFNVQCENYWELGVNHREILGYPSTRKLLGRLLSKDLNIQAGSRNLLGYQNYFSISDPSCEPEDRYILIGRKVAEELAPDVLSCSCGNGYCGVDENSLSCPSDCSSFIRKENTPQIAFFLSLLSFLLGLVAFVRNWVHSKQDRPLRKKARQSNFVFWLRKFYLSCLTLPFIFFTLSVASFLYGLISLFARL